MNPLYRLAIKVLRWPPFLYAIFLLYWSVTLGTATYRVEWLNFRKKRNDVLGWTRAMKLFFNYKALKVGTQDLYRKECMYLCNHRSWADFVVDQYVTEGRSMFMSRWAVFFVFPTFMWGIHTLRAVLLFKRATIKDKEAFNNWIDGQLAYSFQTALAVYPEGHRSTRRESLPLKTGMLKYAYSRKRPTQIVIGANKESILSEKHKTARVKQVVAVGYSEVIFPEKYPTFEEFMAKVQTTWDAQWKTVFSADFSKLPELVEAKADYDYPMEMRVKCFSVYLATNAIFVLAMYLSYLAGLKVLNLCAPYQMHVLGALLAYVALAFYVFSKPVDALTIHEALRGQRRSKPAVVASQASLALSESSEDIPDNAELKKAS